MQDIYQDIYEEFRQELLKSVGGEMRECILKILKIQGRKYECGTYFLENGGKIYSFVIGADGCILNSTIGGSNSSFDEISRARENRNYLGLITQP